MLRAGLGLLQDFFERNPESSNGTVTDSRGLLYGLIEPPFWTGRTEAALIRLRISLTHRRRFRRNTTEGRCKRII